MDFRLDINGLRAVAVIMVVLFHLDIPPFSGGFIGVDIFFVISGYLMTSIIISGLNNKSFSIFKFYLSRCKRIIPPLALMCVTLMILCFFIIPPSEYKTLSKHVFSSMSFISNMVYYKESDYFDTSSNYKWLLHTWSLSVEWQFYIILPLVLMLARKVVNKKYTLFITLFAFISLAFSMYLSNKNPSLSYFFFFSRCWEMLLGGVISQISQPKITDVYKKSIAYFCIGILLISSMLIDESVTWPGFFTIIPVTATSLILLMNTKIPILDSNPLQKTGLWSYSIYLYHWPISVLFGVFFKELTTETKTIAFALSIFLGWASYKIIEDKERGYYSKLSNPFLTLPLAALITTISFSFFLLSGMPSRANERVNYISSLSKDFFYKAEKCFVLEGTRSPECKFGKNKKNDDVDLVIIGDSHAYATLSAVIESNKNASIVFIAQSSCPAIPNIIRVSRPQCGLFMSNEFNSIKEKYKNAKILITNRFSQYIHGENGSRKIQKQFNFKDGSSSEDAFFKKMTSEIKKLGSDRKVFILSPIPDYPYDVVLMASRIAMMGLPVDIKEKISTYRERSDDINYYLNSMADNNKNIHILNSSQYLCDDNYCYGSVNGIPIYRDSNHLTNKGNKRLVSLFKLIWE